MHEFSIAVNIIEIVEQNANKVKANCVNEITIEVGELSGVVEEALEQAMQQAKENTIASGSKIKIINIKGVFECKDCKQRYNADNLYELCPVCNSNNKNILKGQELKIKSIKVD